MHKRIAQLRLAVTLFFCALFGVLMLNEAYLLLMGNGGSARRLLIRTLCASACFLWLISDIALMQRLEVKLKGVFGRTDDT